MQGPEAFLNQLGIKFASYTDPAKPAILDSLYRIIIGYETFFFADSTGKANFETKVTALCGTLTDPITRERFKPNDNSPTLTYNDRVYYFSSEPNMEMFNKMPDMYALPNFEMLPKDTTQNTKSGS